MNGTVFGYKKADNYAYEDGKQDTVGVMSCLLFCGQVVWGEKLTLQEVFSWRRPALQRQKLPGIPTGAAYWSYRSFRADYLLR